jgi:hypothetical protein
MVNGLTLSDLECTMSEFSSVVVGGGGEVGLVGRVHAAHAYSPLMSSAVSL